MNEAIDRMRWESWRTSARTAPVSEMRRYAVDQQRLRGLILLIAEEATAMAEEGLYGFVPKADIISADHYPIYPGGSVGMGGAHHRRRS
jgi:hypothetical protein